MNCFYCKVFGVGRRDGVGEGDSKALEGTAGAVFMGKKETCCARKKRASRGKPAAGLVTLKPIGLCLPYRRPPVGSWS